MPKTWITIITILIAVIIIAPTSALAKSKVFEHKVDQPFSGNQSPHDAYIAAVARAKNEVLDMAGTYIESLTVVENSMLSKDEATALAAGILKTEIVSRNNYATPKTFGLILSTKIEVDTDVLKQRVKKLLNDRTLLRKYNELQQRQQELLARIHQLEQQNSQQTQSSAQPQVTMQFAKLSAALTASQWHTKALKLWNQGRYSDPLQAIKFIDKALELDPDNSNLFNARAVADLNLKRYDAAQNDLNRALKLNPDYADAHNNMGSLYFQRLQYQLAIEEYSRAISLQPDFAEALINRAMAERQLLQYEKALADFRRATELAPNSSALTRRAGSNARLDDIDKLCSKAQTACGMGLCNALHFLTTHGFCQTDDTHQSNSPTTASHQ